MQLEFERFQTSPAGDASVLQEMFESEELFNEGLLSFEYPLFHASDEELDLFLGKLVKDVGRAASNVGKAVGSAAKAAGKVVNTVTSIVPTNVLTYAWGLSPIAMAARAGLGALQAAGSGKNVFQGAIRSMAMDPVSRMYVDTAAGVLRGDNVLKSLKGAAQAQIGDARESLRFATMVAPFVPGVGTGVAAALGAANALASGQPITDALIAGARNALPGGAVAQTAFDMATNLAKGKNLADAALSAARARLPGGPAAQAAFDAGLALAKGKSIQEAAFAAAGRLLPKSPYAADALAFAKKVAAGENIQRAALSAAGNLVLNRIEKQVGPIITGATRGIGRVPAISGQHRAVFQTARTIGRGMPPTVPWRLAKEMSETTVQGEVMDPRRDAEMRRKIRSLFAGDEVMSEVATFEYGDTGRWYRHGDRILVRGL